MKSFHIPNPVVLMTMILLSLPSFTFELDEQSFEKFFANIKSFAQTGAAAELVKDLQRKEAPQKVLDLFERARPLREFTQTEDGKIIVSYLEGYIRDNETKRFLNSIAHLAPSQKGAFSSVLQYLCLSESLTSFQIRKEFCATAMNWYGLDYLRSRELLEHATTLNSHGLVDVVANLSAQVSALKAEFDSELKRAYTIAFLWFLRTDEESRSFVEGLLTRELPGHSKERLFEFIFESNGLESWLSKSTRAWR